MANDSVEQPSWFTPSRLLLIFCFINLLNYLDRGAIASNGVNGVAANSTCNPQQTCYRGNGIQGDFRLSYFEDGVLASAFMVGLLVASPFFAQLAKTHNPFRLIGVGLSVWAFATACCGISIDFWTIVISRMLVGVGEASFVSLAAPFIIDHAPPERKAAWLSVFYMCIPVGMALGYVYGGLVGGLLNWRVAFLGEAVLMLPFAILGFASGPIKLKEDQVNTDSSINGYDPLKKEKWNLTRIFNQLCQQVKVLMGDVRVLFQNRVYAANVFGYIAFIFVLGAYSYWGPKAGYAIYALENADFVFGGVTIICGVIGTIAGGLVLDYLGSTISVGFKLLAVTTLIGGAACLLAFMSKTLGLFIPLFSLGEVFLFATQGPVNYLSLQCVPPVLRPLSMAVSTVFIHIFGDVPSSPLVGALQDQIHNWRMTALILTSIFFVASFIWFIGVLISTDDRSFSEILNNQTEQAEGSQQAFLLSKE